MTYLELKDRETELMDELDEVQAAIAEIERQESDPPLVKGLRKVYARAREMEEWSEA